VFPNEETQAAPYTLNCSYCQWSSTDIGVEFEKPTGISGTLKISTITLGQLSKLVSPATEPQGEFDALKDHYAALFDAGRPSDDALASFSSRYSALLAGKGSFKARQSTRSLFGRMRPSSRDAQDKPLEYAEARTLDDEDALITRLQSLTTLEDTTTSRQRAKQVSKPRWENELWPINMQLRAKRSKRCRACRHILVKPENKPTSTRFRIKMLALYPHKSPF
jgi:dynactin-4